MAKKLVILLALIIVGGYLLIGWQGSSSKPAKLTEKDKSAKVIDFTLMDVTGKPVKLKDYRDKFVLLNIWATWCGPCRYEIPDLIRLRKRYKDKDFEIIGIVVSSPEKNVIKMIDEFGIDYPVVWGTREALQQFGPINAIPRTFLLNKEGQIVEDIVGSRDFKFFNAMLQKYISL